MPSGKQILLSLLSEYSQKQTPANEIEHVTQRVKACLLLHGSTSNYMWRVTDKLAWLQETDEVEEIETEYNTQGLGLAESGLLLSNLFDLMTQTQDIPEDVKEVYPDLTQDAYLAGVHSIWLLLRSLEWSKTYEDVEEGGALDLSAKERLLKSYQRKLIEFKNDPEDYS